MLGVGIESYYTCLHSIVDLPNLTKQAIVCACVCVCTKNRENFVVISLPVNCTSAFVCMSMCVCVHYTGARRNEIKFYTYAYVEWFSMLIDR